MEAATQQTDATSPSKARLARGLMLYAALMVSTTILFASWFEYGGALRRESTLARREIKNTVRKATRPIKQAWREAKRALKSL